jgi:hypothetical protein
MFRYENVKNDQVSARKWHSPETGDFFWGPFFEGNWGKAEKN